MLKDPKILWLALAAILVILFELLALSSIKLEQKEAILVFGSIIGIVGYATLWSGLKALFRLNFQNIHLLMLIAVIGAFFIGRYEEAAVVIVLFSLAEKLEDYGIAKSKSSLDLLMEQMPKYAYIKGMDEPVDVAEVKLGEIIRIKPYHLIPLDGKVVWGQSLVDESTITGEFIPADKRLGDAVFAGTLNKQGVLEVEVSKVSGESVLASIRKMTQDAAKHKAEIQRFIEEFSGYYTPMILILALLLVWVAWMTDKPLEEGAVQALSLLVISCPCALVISTPIAIYSAVGAASSAGVWIKAGRALEAIGRVKAIAFDKTRTLTQGKPVVTDVIPFGDCTREELLGCAAGLELHSEHPLASGVLEAAKKEKLVPHAVEKFESIAGKGAKADCLVCYDKHHCIGKLEFILEEHRVPSEVLEAMERLQAEGKTVVVISTHRQVEGIIAFADEIREESAKVIAALKRLGIVSVMLTGDHALTAKAVAKSVGIKMYRSELLPQDKVVEIQDLAKKYRLVGMVGDGVNDAPALAAASVGISIVEIGSDTAIEAASIIILKNHLNRIPYLVRLGRRTLTMIHFNTIFAVGVKVLFVVLAILGISGLAPAIFADVGVTLLVILNSLRLMKFVPDRFRDVQK